MKTALAFAIGVLRSPRRVGAIAPASARLAAAVAAEARRAPARVVIEAGAGTGAITRELLRIMPADTQFIAYEREPHYVALLRRRYPHAETLQQCASRLEERTALIDGPVTIISSLPLLSMPAQEVSRCVGAFVAALLGHPHSRLIHYTYRHAWTPPFPVPDLRLRWRRAAVVWGNLPPATVWTLEHRQA